MKKVWSTIFRGLKAYLCNWRNLLGHALLGVVFLAAALWAPVPLWIKLVFIACLIAFNIVRMRLAAKRKNAEDKDSAQSSPDAHIQEGETL